MSSRGTPNAEASTKDVRFERPSSTPNPMMPGAGSPDAPADVEAGAAAAAEAPPDASQRPTAVPRRLRNLVTHMSDEVVTHMSDEVEVESVASERMQPDGDFWYTWAVVMPNVLPVASAPVAPLRVMQSAVIEALLRHNLEVSVLKHTRGSRKHLVVLVSSESEDDWLLRAEAKLQDSELYLSHGILPRTENPKLSPAARVHFTGRIVDRAVAMARASAKFKEARREVGAQLGKRKFSIIERSFPLHDRKKNKQLMAALTPTCSVFSDWAAMKEFLFAERQVEQLRSYFGERVGFYFAYLDYYNTFLYPLTTYAILLYSVFRFVDWPAYQRGLSLLGLFTACMWGPLFVKCWKRRERRLAFRWHVSELPDTMVPNQHNPKYKVFFNPRTGERERKYDPNNNRLKVRLASVAFAFVNLVLLVFICSPFIQWYVYGKLAPTCACCDWFLHRNTTLSFDELRESAHAHGITQCDSYIASIGRPEYLAPTSCIYFVSCFNSPGGHVGTDRWVYILIQGIVLGILMDIAQDKLFFRAFTRWLTRIENWETEALYEQHLIRKQAFFSWFNMYFWFLALAFVYVPFGGVVQHFFISIGLGVIVPGHGWRTGVINIDEAFVTPLVVTQAVNLVLETFLPYAMNKGKLSWRKQRWCGWCKCCCCAWRRRHSAGKRTVWHRSRNRKPAAAMPAARMFADAFGVAKMVVSRGGRVFTTAWFHDEDDSDDDSDGSDSLDTCDVDLTGASIAGSVIGGTPVSAGAAGGESTKVAPSSLPLATASPAATPAESRPGTPTVPGASSPADPSLTALARASMPSRAPSLSRVQSMLTAQEAALGAAAPHVGEDEDAAEEEEQLSSDRFGTANEADLVDEIRQMWDRSIGRTKKPPRLYFDAASPDASQYWADEVVVQSEMEVFNPTPDYLDMVMQFGYVTMFTTAWPLATACAVINNFFELRGDAFRLLFDNRRPRPRAVKGIGEWLEMLWLVCKLSVAVSAGLIAVGTGQAEFWAEQWCENQAERLQRNAALGEESVEGVVAEEMLGIMGPDMNCFSSWGVRLFIFLALEHIGLGIIYAVQTNINDDSHQHREDVHVRTVSIRKIRQDRMIPDIKPAYAANLRDVFDYYAGNTSSGVHSGDHRPTSTGVRRTLSTEQATRMLRDLNRLVPLTEPPEVPLSDATAKSLISFLDVNGSESVSYGECAAAARRAQLDPLLCQTFATAFRDSVKLRASQLRRAGVGLSEDPLLLGALRLGTPHRGEKKSGHRRIVSVPLGRGIPVPLRRTQSESRKAVPTYDGAGGAASPKVEEGKEAEEEDEEDEKGSDPGEG